MYVVLLHIEKYARMRVAC